MSDIVQELQKAAYQWRSQSQSEQNSCLVAVLEEAAVSLAALKAKLAEAEARCGKGFEAETALAGRLNAEIDRRVLADAQRDAASAEASRLRAACEEAANRLHAMGTWGLEADLRAALRPAPGGPTP